MPTPTLGKALIAFFTVAWSGKLNITAPGRQTQYFHESPLKRQKYTSILSHKKKY
jgi:hypothetical protein